MKDIEPLKPEGIRLIGGWVKIDNEIRPDAVLSRIRYLVDEQLQRLGTDETGWDTLFRDPLDGRYWELIYPQSEMHGGGPPALVNLLDGDALTKYPHLF